jgi:hypothetical protein
MVVIFSMAQRHYKRVISLEERVVKSGGEQNPSFKMRGVEHGLRFDCVIRLGISLCGLVFEKESMGE